MHRLTEKDLEKKTGVCITCGPVALAKRSNGYGCATARHQDTTRARVSGDEISAKHKHKTREPYGLNRGQASALKAGQKCTLCPSTDTLVVDHCHASGRIRGVLCRKCNLVLGLMDDDPERLRAAAAYLER